MRYKFGEFRPGRLVGLCRNIQLAVQNRLYLGIGHALRAADDPLANLVSEDLATRIDLPDLDVNPDDVLVLKHIGPKGAAMPEAGYMPIPRKLAMAGVKDMVRISDGRMSGTIVEVAAALAP